MNELDNFKSKITSDRKTIIGLIGIIAVVVCSAFSLFYTDWLRVLLIMLPAVFLVFPNPQIRYNKIVGIVFAIISAISLIFAVLTIIDTVTYFIGYADFEDFIYFLVQDIALILVSLYALFCSLLLLVPTGEEAQQNVPAYMNANNNVAKASFCRECGAKINTNSAFCPECGKRL